MKNLILFLLLLSFSIVSVGQVSLDSIFMEAKKNYIQKNYDSAVFYFEKIVLAENIKTKDEYYLQYKSCLGLAGIYINQAKNKIAIEYLEKAEIFCTEKLGREDLLIYVYNNIAIVYQNQKKYKIAIEYYHKAETICFNQNKTESLGGIYNNIGSIYYYQKNYTQSLYYTKKSIEYKKAINSNSIGITYCNLARVYREIGKFDLSESYFKLAIKENKIYNSSANIELADIYMGYGKLKAKMNEAECLDLFKKSIQINKDFFGSKYIRITKTNIYIGDFYLEQKDFENALLYYQKAIITAHNTFSGTNWETNPTDFDTYSEIYLIYAFKQKAEALYLYSKTSDMKQFLLEKSLETYLLASDLIEISNNTYLNNEDKFSLIESEKKTYNKIIDIAFQLNELTNEQSYLETAFLISDKSKSIILINSLLENEVLFHSESDSVKYSEINELAQEIGDLEYLISQTSNPAVISELSDKKFELKKIYEAKMDSLRTKNSSQILSNYQNEISVSKIQKLMNNDETIVEYSLTHEYIYIFAISKNDFKAVQVKRDNAFNNSLEFVLNHFSEHSFIDYDIAQINTFYASLYTLYKKLFQPIESIATGKRLVIIPDGELNLLPFDILITQEETREFNEYGNAAYLIYDYIISYAYSAQIKFYDFKKHAEKQKTIIAFAPTYQKITDTTEQYYEQVRNITNLSNIAGATYEVKSISEILKTKTCFEAYANKINFFKQINDYKIIHLALHSVTDTINSKLSGLVFSCDTNNVDILHNYEIQNLNIMSELVVLSSCNTGGGKLISGEGVMSIGRNFFLGGSRSVIMTLWTIPDKSSSEVIKLFYSYLSQNYPIDESLQLSKIDFLQKANSQTSNPYYWSAYAVTGDNNFSIKVASSQNQFLKRYIIFPVLIIFGICLIIFLVLFLKKQEVIIIRIIFKR